MPPGAEDPRYASAEVRLDVRKLLKLLSQEAVETGKVQAIVISLSSSVNASRISFFGRTRIPDKMPKFPDGGLTLPDGGGGYSPPVPPCSAAPDSSPLVLGEMRHHVEEFGQLNIIIKHKLQDLCCNNIVQTVRL
jgi:hypothetical protein